MPDYPKLAQLWWKNVAVAVTGEKTPQAAMDNLADEMDQVMAAWSAPAWPLRAQAQPKSDPTKWLSDKGAPWKKLANEKPKGETIAYDKLLEGVEGRPGPLARRRPADLHQPAFGSPQGRCNQKRNCTSAPMVRG